MKLEIYNFLKRVTELGLTDNLFFFSDNWTDNQFGSTKRTYCPGQWIGFYDSDKDFEGQTDFLTLQDCSNNDIILIPCGIH